MAQQRSDQERIIPAELAALGQKRIDELISLQAEFLDQLRNANQQWLDRVQSETNSASELAAKLTAVRSIPDAMEAYQEWIGRRFNLMAEDGKRVLDNAQKLTEAGARLMADGWLARGGGT